MDEAKQVDRALAAVAVAGAIAAYAPRGRVPAVLALPACSQTGEVFGANHYLPTYEVGAVSPANAANTFSTVNARGVILNVALPSHRIAAMLGWVDVTDVSRGDGHVEMTMGDV